MFGLPGNPVSSMVSFELFARPALRTMMALPESTGDASPRWPTTPFRRRPDGKTHFQRAVAHFGADGRVHVGPGRRPRAATSWRPTSLADAMVVLPDGDGAAAQRRRRHDPAVVTHQ